MREVDIWGLTCSWKAVACSGKPASVKYSTTSITDHSVGQLTSLRPEGQPKRVLSALDWAGLPGSKGMRDREPGPVAAEANPPLPYSWLPWVGVLHPGTGKVHKVFTP